MRPVHIAPTVDPRVRYVVMPLEVGYAVFQSIKRDGRWVVCLATGEPYAALAAAVMRANELAGVRAAA